MAESDHDLMSPSKWPVWNICPSYIPDGKESAEAAEGTKAHEDFANIVLRKPVTDPLLQSEWAADLVFTLVRQLAADRMLYIEKRVEYHGGGIDYAGTVDLFFYDDENTLHVIDFKTFADGSFNHFPQLEGYALAIAQEHSYPFDKPICLHVLCGGSFKKVSMLTNAHQCLDTASRIFGLVKMSHTLPPKANTHCKYCACCATCPESLNKVQEMSETSVEVVKDSMPMASNEGIVKLLEQCTVAEAVISAIRGIVKDEVAKRGSVTANGIRYEIKEENGAAKVRDADALFGYLTSHGVTTEEILKQIKLGMPAAVKLIRGADFDIKNDKEARAKLSPFFDIPKVAKLKRIVD